MNEFVMYETLCSLEGIVASYASGRDLLPKIRYAKEMVSTRRYRIAVVGMFKCGKSTLINALVGTSILPTDTLPTTAVINRIIYGDTKQITICCRDGRTERRSIQDLADYATQKGGKIPSSDIREIIVEYPSVFCRNRIEIIDTPGLNDNDLMTETTFGVLGDINSAIVTISALEPLSMTERDLIVSLIQQKGIHHIIFVITFIDQVSRRPGDQDRIIDFIRKRLQTEVFSYIEEQWAGDPEMLLKARNMLKDPVLFAVSAVLALKGFEYDDPDILEESRFPRFKQELFDLLIAGQSADMYQLAMECVREADLNLGQWHHKQLKQLNDEHDVVEKKMQLRSGYVNDKGHMLQMQLQQTDHALRDLVPESDNLLDSEEIRADIQELRRYFIKEVSSLRAGHDSDPVIRQCLTGASARGFQFMKNRGLEHQRRINTKLFAVTDTFSKLRYHAGFDEKKLKDRITAWSRENAFPVFKWSSDPTLPGRTLHGIDIMPVVNEIILTSLKQYAGGLQRFISSWRKTLIELNAEDRQEGETDALRRLEHIRVQQDIAERMYEENRRKVSEWKRNME